MFRKFAKKALRYVSDNNYETLLRIEIDRQRLLHNVSYFQEQHPGMQVIPVLKGNAYGHGLTEVAEALEASSVEFVAVDGYFEAARIRDITHHKILVMGYILPVNLRLLDTKRCSFVVQDTEGLHAFGSLNKPVRIHLELNTGMNRLGLQPGEVAEYLEVLQSYPKLQLEGVMTHLADADNAEDDSYTARQLANFDAIVARIIGAGFRPSFIHIAQTAGSVKVKSQHANAIRTGIGTYGINPLLPSDPQHARLSGLQPVLELKAKLIKVLDLKQGDKVSYNCTFVAPRAMRVGVLPLGYYEGVSRELSNKGVVTHGDTELPIVGRICMDHMMVDLLDTDLAVKDELTVISKEPNHNNSVANLQAKHGLFAYTTVTGLSSSVRRKVV